MEEGAKPLREVGILESINYIRSGDPPAVCFLEEPLFFLREQRMHKSRETAMTLRGSAD